MARFTVYLPDDLRDHGHALGLNMSGLLRMQIVQALHELAGNELGARRAAQQAAALRANVGAGVAAAHPGHAPAPPGATV